MFVSLDRDSEHGVDETLNKVVCILIEELLYQLDNILGTSTRAARLCACRGVATVIVFEL